MAGAVGAGVALVTFLLLATIVSCICCPQCPNYDKSSTFQKQHKRTDADLTLSIYTETICWPGRVYRPHPAEAGGVTKSLSVSNGSPSLGHHHQHHHQLGLQQLGQQHGAATQLAHSEQQLGRGWAAAGQQPGYRHSMDLMVAGGGGGMSHSYTLPHSMSHHSSKYSIVLQTEARGYPSDGPF